MINGVSIGLTGMTRYSRMFDRAAEQVVRSGMRHVDPAIEVEGGMPANPNAVSAVSPTDDLIDGVVDMMLAQRLFMASIQVTRAEDQMMETAVNIADKK